MTHEAEADQIVVRLRELDEKREALLRRLAELREAPSSPASAAGAPSSRGEPAGTLSTREKLALFRSLFRGRDDVYPKLWENGGKKGYSPACANEFVRLDDLCKKILKPPLRKSCGACPNQGFQPITDAVILDHFRGKHTVGVYALLPDETCWFLAADFDKSTWQSDVTAFVETCRSFDLHPAVERSRSGNGAHVWFFFTSPVPAATARRMGCWLLTETMARRHELSMDSYDRFFPNQDTMPKGGFGNLIALPFQDGPRRGGNSVFVDDRFEPFADPWAHLAGLPRLDPARVEALAAAAARAGQVLGVQLAMPDDPDERAPWARAPSRKARPVAVTGPLPASIQVVLGQGIFVEKGDLPSPILNQIKRLAAFQNPEFYKRQAMRLHTNGTPRVITCAGEEALYVSIPRGLLDELRDELAAHGVGVDLQDERTLGEPLPVGFVGELREGQGVAVGSVLQHDVGLLVAPPGTGKTVMAAAIISARGRSTLVLVHTKALLSQWIDRLASFLRVERDEIGVIGGGKDRPTGRLDVAMIQSLVDREGVDDRVAGYGHVVVDEAHHISAVSFERVLREVKARYVLGLTATPIRRDGHHPILHMQCGPIRANPRGTGAGEGVPRVLLRRDTGVTLPELPSDAPITHVYASLAAHEGRTAGLVNDVEAAVRDGRTPIVLTERLAHLQAIADRLRAVGLAVVTLQGGMGKKAKAAADAALAAPAGEQATVLVATGRFVGEGFDYDRLDTLFLALPVSWKGIVEQYVGRLHRSRPGKIDVRVYDYVDGAVPVLGTMWERRKKKYVAMGYVEAEIEPGQVRLEFGGAAAGAA